MMANQRVAFCGSEGRMGRALIPLLRDTVGLSLVAELDVGDDIAAALQASTPDVVVDFTSPQSARTNTEIILRAGAHAVVGTTGFTEDDLRAIDVLAKDGERCALVVPNFSLGMILLQRFADEAAKYFPRAEIVETHHEGKRDAPSGTAAHTARRMGAAGAKAGPAPEAEARGIDVDGVRVHSMRLPGIHARQSVYASSEHEGLVLTHEAFSRECYLQGVVLAIRAAPQHVGLVHGLEHLL